MRPAPGGADTVRVPGEFSPLRDGGSGADTDSVAPDSWRTGPAAGQWTDLPAYPTRVMDNAVGEHDGKIYSVGGMVDGVQLTEGYVYDPAEESWSQIASLPALRQAAAGAFIDGQLYVVGGCTNGPPLRAQVLNYPSTDWTETMTDYPSITENADNPTLPLSRLRAGRKLSVPPALDPRSVSPLKFENLADLPPTLVVTAALDPLNDHGCRYVERLREDGTDARLTCYPKATHTFLSTPA